MVRPRRLAGRQLVEAPAEQRSSQPRPDRRDAVPVAVALLLVVPLVLGEEVEDVHAPILYLRRVSLLAVALALALPQHGVLVPGRSLGGIRLGMTQPQVERAWGTNYGRCRNCTRTTWYFNYEKYHAQGAAVSFRNGRVDAVWTLWKPDGWRRGQALTPRRAGAGGHRPSAARS